MAPANLKSLAEKLLREGPHKVLAIPRRIRALHGGAYFIDTTHATYIWEHPYYPSLYVPTSELGPKTKTKFSTHVLEEIKDPSNEGSVGAKIVKLTIGSSSTDRVISFESSLQGPAAPLAGTTRIEFGSIDAWYEEDQHIYVHPKDPFKRIDILPSSRPIDVQVGGHTVVKQSAAHHLYETGLRTRYYLPPTAVDPSILRPSSTRSLCPYKGEAEYYDIVLPDGQEFKDVIWYYRTPTIESAAITGLYCFYNEKVDLWLDGVKEEK